MLVVVCCPLRVVDCCVLFVDVRCSLSFVACGVLFAVRRFWCLFIVVRVCYYLLFVLLL